jgi:hypothetical protein
MDVDIHRAQRGRVRVKSRPAPFNLTGLEMLMFALLGGAVLDALLVTWLFIRGVTS